MACCPISSELVFTPILQWGVVAVSAEGRRDADPALHTGTRPPHPPGKRKPLSGGQD